MGFQEFTIFGGVYNCLQTVEKGGYKELEGVTKGYKGLQRVTKG